MKNAILLFFAMGIASSLAGPNHHYAPPHRGPSVVHSSQEVGVSNRLGTGGRSANIYREGRLLSTKSGHH